MVEVHYFSMIVIGIGSFIFGILPVVFSFRVIRNRPFFLSLILCLGGGVLLSTSLVHMLTEVQPKLKAYAQLYLCGGFIILYTLDEISHYCLKSREAHEENGTERNRQNNYGATQSVCFPNNAPLLTTTESKVDLEVSFENNYSHARYEENKDKLDCPQGQLQRSHERDHSEDALLRHPENEFRKINSAATTGLLVALLIHSIIEGVSIGVQTGLSQILLILGAVTFHKVVLSFCLGLELYCQGLKLLYILGAIFLFSIGSPIGILLGMTVTSLEDKTFGINEELQAVAAGNLLYVAVFEVLPRERFKWQQNSNKKTAGIFQLVFFVLGFISITVFHFAVGE